MQLPSESQWIARCAGDGEFQCAARHWNGALTLRIGTQSLSLGINDGVPGVVTAGTQGIEYSGSESVWNKVLAAVPERFHNDLMANASVGEGISRSGDPLMHAQYYAAVMRAVELLRPGEPDAAARAGDSQSMGHIEQAVGRYVHLQLNGQDFRVYFEEAGQGIPVLLQHTAGCHGSQWRHLLEDSSITDRFRLIAYDLPFHGKSLPPVGAHWWQEPYALRGEFLRSVPLALTRALRLDRPVFAGCSVGGLLALDLAHKHADVFRAVISIEGALHIGGSLESLSELWHPQVSNEYKARLMEGLIAPTSPLAYRKETAFVYAAGWPASFLGDLHYYIDEFDLREQAGEIDTNKVGVHILSGEYDYSGTSELGQQAHAAIAGSTWREMAGVGHFPMSENPDAFLQYLYPILDQIQ